MKELLVNGNITFILGLLTGMTLHKLYIDKIKPICDSVEEYQKEIDASGEGNIHKLRSKHNRNKEKV